ERSASARRDGRAACGSGHVGGGPARAPRQRDRQRRADDAAAPHLSHVSSGSVSTTPEHPASAAAVDGVDADDLATTLRVLGMLHELPAGHEDITAVKRATASMHNRVKKTRRREARQEERGPKVVHDQAILAQTATGSPSRFDDETKGIALTSATGARYAGELQLSRGCY